MAESLGRCYDVLDPRVDGVLVPRPRGQGALHHLVEEVAPHDCVAYAMVTWGGRGGVGGGRGGVGGEHEGYEGFAGARGGVGDGGCGEEEVGVKDEHVGAGGDEEG